MEELLLRESSDEDDYVRVYRNDTINHVDYRYNGRVPSVEFRREYTDVKEEDTIAIPLDDIPELISYLKRILEEEN